jgi:hypothetical protein
MKCIDASNFDMTYADIIVPVLNATYTIRDIIKNGRSGALLSAGDTTRTSISLAVIRYAPNVRSRRVVSRR